MEKRALLFDAGDIRNLKPADLHKITDVFITHTHMDHFIGFDMIMRTLLRRDRPLNVYGPARMAAFIEGKLRGYNWNMIHEYPFVLHVYSYSGKALTHSVFSAQNKFRKESGKRITSDGTLLRDPLFHVTTEVLDHGIPCLAYSLQETVHINIDKDRLQKKGLSVGPWLTEFKRIYRKDNFHQKKIVINGVAHRMDQLTDIAIITKGQKISYATDIAMSSDNIARLTNLIKDSDIFYCEAYFMDKDRERAFERFHLTAKTCGTIAKNAGVNKLVPMHFSPKYSDCPEAVFDEAMEAFQS
jgi:ribonuclease Z